MGWWEGRGTEGGKEKKRETEGLKGREVREGILPPIKITKDLICRCANLTYSPVILTLKSNLNLNCTFTCTVADSF